MMSFRCREEVNPNGNFAKRRKTYGEQDISLNVINGCGPTEETNYPGEREANAKRMEDKAMHAGT